MDWNIQKTSSFIEDYHTSPELWNNKNASYKDRNVKNDKLKLLATKYECSVDQVKRKIKNLRSAFRREHKRITKLQITKIRSGSSKKQKWFAYNLLAFLLDVDNPRQTFSAAENSEEEDDLASDTFDGQLTISPTPTKHLHSSDDATNLSSNEGSVKQFISPKKKVKRFKPASSYSKREEEAYAVLQQVMKKDECTIYGEHIANELRDLQPRARTIVKHLINNILFEAAMGNYNDNRSSTSYHGNMATTSTSTSTCLSRSLQSHSSKDTSDSEE